MNFFEAIQSGFSNYVNFKGRAIRSEYNYWYLFSSLVGILTLFIDWENYFNNGFSLLNTGASLILFLPGIAVVVRRFHDINKSGWNMFWCFTIIGIIPVYYWLFFKKGNSDKNFYGVNPLGENLEYKKDDIDFDDISKLEKLAKLKEEGHITEEEYNDKKKELL